MNCFVLFAVSIFSKIKNDDIEKPPFLLFPPMFGSVLFGTVTNVPTYHWFCPKNLQDSWIWQADQYLIYPLTDCMADYLKCGWNYTTNKPDSRNESYIYTVDIGGDQGIRFMDKGIFGHHYFHSMDDFLNDFEQRGFVVRKNLYGAPYDWRLSPIATDEYYVQVKQIIEQAYESHNKRKVILFGYSGGCMAIQYFLTRIVDQAWKDKYIDYQILLAPSTGGSADSLICLWSGVSWFPNADTIPMSDFLLSIPTMYAHMPNYIVHENFTAVIDPNGKEYSYRQVRELLYEKGKINVTDNRKVFEYSEKNVMEVDYMDPGVDSYIMFNSVIDTPIGMNFTGETSFESNKMIDLKFFGLHRKVPAKTLSLKDWGESNVIMGKGDNTISSAALYYPCHNWRSGHTVFCHDYRVYNDSFNHGAMMGYPEVVDELYYALVNTTWRNKKGNFLLAQHDLDFNKMEPI